MWTYAYPCYFTRDIMSAIRVFYTYSYHCIIIPITNSSHAIITAKYSLHIRITSMGSLINKYFHFGTFPT